MFWKADIRLGTRILASAIEAGQSAGTVLVNAAFWFGWAAELFAGHIRVSGSSWATLTNRLVFLAAASGCISTRLCIAHLPTDSVKSITCLIFSAVFIVLALASDTSHQRIALVTWFANTVGTVILGEALGTLAALLWAVVAWIQTLFVVASLVVRALRIALAFSCGRW